MRPLFLLAALLCLALLAGCYRVSHLADRTGEAYGAVFARQERARRAEAPKAMEAELGQAATRTLVSRAAKTRSRGDVAGRTSWPRAGN